MGDLVRLGQFEQEHSSRTRRSQAQALNREQLWLHCDEAATLLYLPALIRKLNERGRILP